MQQGDSSCIDRTIPSFRTADKVKKITKDKSSTMYKRAIRIQIFNSYEKNNTLQKRNSMIGSKKNIDGN